PGGVAEQPELLLQVDVDAAEEDAALAHVLLVGADGRVGGHQERVVALAGQGGGQGVVMHAGAAEHAGGARGDGGGAHTAAPYRGTSASLGGGSSVLHSRPTRTTNRPIPPAV